MESEDCVGTPMQETGSKKPNKRARHATGSTSTLGGVTPGRDLGGSNWNYDLLQTMSVDDKLNLIINNMGEMRRMYKHLFDKQISCFENTVYHKVTDDRLNYLEYKILDREARTKERNLLFSGITESVGENQMEKILLLLHNKLGFPAETVFIVEARRIGRVIHQNASNRCLVRQRDLLVTFGNER